MYMQADHIPHSFLIRHVPNTALWPSLSVQDHTGSYFTFHTQAICEYLYICFILWDQHYCMLNIHCNLCFYSWFPFHVISDCFNSFYFFGWMLYLCMRLCRGVRCHLTGWLTAFKTGLYNGCVSGRVASWTAACCLCLSTRSQNGSRFAITSTMSMAVVLMAPVIIIAACYWIDASFVSTACFVLLLSEVFMPTFWCGVRKISAVYSILGIAMEIYSWQKYLACIPLVVRTILLK